MGRQASGAALWVDERVSPATCLLLCFLSVFKGSAAAPLTHVPCSSKALMPQSLLLPYCELTKLAGVVSRLFLPVPIPVKLAAGHWILKGLISNFLYPDFSM